MRRHLPLSDPRRTVRVAMLAITLSTAASYAFADPATSAQSLPTEWKQWNGHHYRLEADGHLSAYSENSAKSQRSINAPQAQKEQPLLCNEARWGGASHKRTGYKKTGHWCNSAYANLFAKWVDLSEFGYPHYLSRTLGGDVMCLSTDGVTCKPAGEVKLPLPAGEEIKPLVCGRTLVATMGFTGYERDRKNHWCQSLIALSEDPGELLRLDEPDMQAYYGRPVMMRTVDMPRWDKGDRIAIVTQVSAPSNRGLELALVGRSMARDADLSQCLDHAQSHRTLTVRFRGNFRDLVVDCTYGWPNLGKTAAASTTPDAELKMARFPTQRFTPQVTSTAYEADPSEKMNRFVMRARDQLERGLFFAVREHPSVVRP